MTKKIKDMKLISLQICTVGHQYGYAEYSYGDYNVRRANNGPVEYFGKWQATKGNINVFAGTLKELKELIQKVENHVSFI